MLTTRKPLAPRKPGTMAYLVRTVAVKLGITAKDARTVIEAFLEVTRSTVKKQGRIGLPAFGTFAVRTRKARQIAAPPTAASSEPIQLPATREIRFRASKHWGLR